MVGLLKPIRDMHDAWVSQTSSYACRDQLGTVTAARAARRPVVGTGYGRPVAEDPSSQAETLSELTASAQRAAEARGAERSALAVRAQAIVAAVRAGARLEEIGEAARMTKAAASAIARRTLPARSSRGGPYSRRRGANLALEHVADTAHRASDASRIAHEAVLERNRSLLAAAEQRVDVLSLASALAMSVPVTRELLRRSRSKATMAADGTVASPMASSAKRTPTIDINTRSDVASRGTTKEARRR